MDTVTRETSAGIKKTDINRRACTEQHSVNIDVTPNDVKSSLQQMCVVYVPITIGPPCNVLHSSNRESKKRGFDRRSSRKNCFVFGGFDRSGWDRWGYGKDGFIDQDGYNMFGFNRYGFNRSNVTWFGMRKEGVFEDENDKKKEKRVMIAHKETK